MNIQILHAVVGTGLVLDRATRHNVWRLKTQKDPASVFDAFGNIVHVCVVLMHSLRSRENQMLKAQTAPHFNLKLVHLPL